MEENVIRPFGYSDMECGYCKGKRSALLSPPKTASDCSRSYGMLADSMTPEMYEGLLYRGWRRSGIHLYKPCNFESCCPTLTIRLKAPQFRPTKSQSKTRRKLENLLHPPTLQSSKRAPNSPPLKKAKSGKPKSKHQGTVKFETLLRQSTLITTIQETTRQALLQAPLILPFLQQQQNGLHSVLSSITSPAHGPSPIVFKVRPVSKSEEQQGRCTISSSICARLAGTLRLDRDQLVQSILPYVQNALIPNNPSSTAHIPNGTSSNGSISNSYSPTVTSVQGHAKSGQILVQLQWPKSPPNASDAEDVSMRDVEDDEDEAIPAGSSKDKLGAWYQATMGRPLLEHQRELKIQTIPAHESALNPEVHRLYTLYQHVVHQDEDPFQEVDGKSPEEVSSSKTSNSNDKNKSSTKEAENENPEKMIQNLDWGNHLPGDFADNAREMLRNYIQPHSLAVQKALVKNYYSFYQFLVESPFDAHQEATKTSQQRQNANGTMPHPTNDLNGALPSPSTDSNTSNPPPCGTYHQHYRIGEALIAVGVVDILPGGLSSVYLYYNPSFSHSLVALGKLAILKEIEYATQTLSRPYYYLGYYIESCPKMRYKGDYHPSQLLCPTTYDWVDCSKALPKLRAAAPLHICALVDEDRQNADLPLRPHETSTVLQRIPMDIGAGMVVTLDMLQPSGQQVVEPILKEFVQEAGPHWAPQCLVKLT